MVNRPVIVANHAMGRAKEVIRLNLEAEIANCRGDRESQLCLLNSLNGIIPRLHKITAQISGDLPKAPLVID